MKLLARTIRSYILYSILLTLVCTPLFYFAIRYIVVREMDEELVSHKEEFESFIVRLGSKDELEFFSFMSKEFILTPGSKWPIRDSIFSQDIRDSLTGQQTPHRVYRTGVTVQGENYELQIRESLVSNKALIGSIVVIQLTMLVFLLTGLVIINGKLSRKIWNPFYLILDKIRRHSLDKEEDMILPRTSTAEFRELAFAIEELIKRNKEVYQNQKEFTENAAHELQTPLAISRTKLELLAQTQELTQGQAELVESILEATDRIARLNKNLLLLARIESRQFMDVTPVDIRILTEKILRVFIHQIEEKALQIDRKYMNEAKIEGNATVLEILLNNLISNAVRHSTPGGIISIEVTSRSVIIKNPGDQLENPEKLFQRFQRSNRSSSIGNGLGLSILKKICDIYQYGIRYSFEDGTHAFEVQFRNGD